MRAWPLCPKLRSLRIFGNDVVVVDVVSHRDRRIQSANYVKSDLLRSASSFARHLSVSLTLSHTIATSTLTARAISAKASQRL